MKESLVHIVSQCKKGDPKSQKALYDMYAPLFMSMAMRYMKNYEAAEDVMLMAFFKIFNKIEFFKNEGSFEGWMKRIVVNEALMQLRKQNNLSLAIEISDVDVPFESSIVDDMSYEELLKLLQELPVGYRTVFNMFVVEGYKHREIAEILNISINTSKSQLILAKKRLRELLKKNDQQSNSLGIRM